METYQFTDIYDFDENAGIVMPDTADLKARVEDMMRTIFGSNIDVTEETPMGRMVEMITVLMTQTLGINAQNANQYNLNQTSGIYLDAIGVLFGLGRKSATRTRVNCVVSGTAGTVIPTTAVVENEAGYQFSPENAITIGAGGTAQGYFLALETGPVPCDHGTLTRIVSGVVGWNAVVNNTATATVYGTNLETDVSYRTRILSARANGSASVEAITNAIYNADDSVSSCFVLENGYSQSIVKRGITIPPHSIYACVNGGTDENVAKAIFKTKTAGAGYTTSAGSAAHKDITVTDEHTSAQYHVHFFRPIETSVSFDVSVERYLYSGTDIVGDVKKALADYLSETGIGATITRENAVSYLAKAMPSIKIDNLLVKLTGDTAQDELSMNANRIPVTTALNINVVLI